MPVQVDLEAEGVVKSYNPKRSPSFGFVTPTDSDIEGDIFFDGKCVKESGLESIRKGVRVRCLCIRGEKGLKAKRIMLL